MKKKQVIMLAALAIVICMILFPFFRNKHEKVKDKVKDVQVKRYSKTEHTLSAEIIKYRNCEYIVIQFKDGSYTIIHAEDCINHK